MQMILCHRNHKVKLVGGRCSSVIECLPSMLEALGSISNTAKISNNNKDWSKCNKITFNENKYVTIKMFISSLTWRNTLSQNLIR